jgi:hypothetical protein
MRLMNLLAVVVLLGCMAMLFPQTAAISALAFFGVGLVSISNPKGYAYDKELVFQNSGASSVDIVPTSAGTVYSNQLSIPEYTNGRIAIEVVSVTDPAPQTKDLVIYACVGNSANPTIPANKTQPIAIIPLGVAFTAGTSFQWIIPEAFQGYKYIRLCFYQAATGTVSVGAINAFMHALA